MPWPVADDAFTAHTKRTLSKDGAIITGRPYNLRCYFLPPRQARNTPKTQLGQKEISEYDYS